VIIDLVTAVLVAALPAIVGIVAQVDKGRRGLAWAFAALLFESMLIYVALAGTPFAVSNSHRDGTLVLAAFCAFIVMLGLVAALPPRSNGQ
jgi:hypothetical protein